MEQLPVECLSLVGDYAGLRVTFSLSELRPDFKKLLLTRAWVFPERVITQFKVRSLHEYEMIDVHTPALVAPSDVLILRELARGVLPPVLVSEEVLVRAMRIRGKNVQSWLSAHIMGMPSTKDLPESLTKLMAAAADANRHDVVRVVVKRAIAAGVSDIEWNKIMKALFRSRRYKRHSPTWEGILRCVINRSTSTQLVKNIAAFLGASYLKLVLELQGMSESKLIVAVVSSSSLTYYNKLIERYPILTVAACLELAGIGVANIALTVYHAEAAIRKLASARLSFAEIVRTPRYSTKRMFDYFDGRIMPKVAWRSPIAALCKLVHIVLQKCAKDSQYLRWLRRLLPEQFMKSYSEMFFYYSPGAAWVASHFTITPCHIYCHTDENGKTFYDHVVDHYDLRYLRWIVNELGFTDSMFNPECAVCGAVRRATAVSISFDEPHVWLPDDFTCVEFVRLYAKLISAVPKSYQQWVNGLSANIRPNSELFHGVWSVLMRRDGLVLTNDAIARNMLTSTCCSKHYGVLYELLADLGEDRLRAVLATIVPKHNWLAMTLWVIMALGRDYTTATMIEWVYDNKPPGPGRRWHPDMSAGCANDRQLREDIAEYLLCHDTLCKPDNERSGDDSGDWLSDDWSSDEDIMLDDDALDRNPWWY